VHSAIEAHLTVVFAALAATRGLQAQTGVSLKKLVQTLRHLRTVTINIDGHTITAKPQLTQDAEQILAKLPPVAGWPTWHESGRRPANPKPNGSQEASLGS
jgi:hypothetical protein